MNLQQELETALKSSQSQSRQVVGLLQELHQCHMQFQNLGASLDNNQMWQKMSKDHYTTLLTFLDCSEILRLRLVSKRFHVMITQCFPVLAMAQQQVCQDIRQQLESLHAQPAVEVNEQEIAKAHTAFQGLQKAHLNELKHLRNPPAAVGWVLKGVHNLLKGEPTKDIDKDLKCSWMTQLLADPNHLLQSLFNLDVQNLNKYQLDQIEYTVNNFAHVTGQSIAASAFYGYLKGIYTIHPSLGQKTKEKLLNNQLKRAEKYSKIFSQQ